MTVAQDLSAAGLTGNEESQAARVAREAERRDARKRWLLLLPSVIIILAAAIGPLFVMVVISFLTKGSYGWAYMPWSTDGWFSVLWEIDIFDDTVSLADAHLAVFWRSLKLSIITTGLTLLLGLPTAYFIATRPERHRDIWLFLITIPFWTNQLIRTFAVQELLRADGVFNNIMLVLRFDKIFAALGIPVQLPVQMLFTDFAIGFGMTYVFLPLMVLPIYASIEKLDFRLVEAGYDLYANKWRVFWRVILPLIKPGVIAGSILVFIPSLGAYVIPRVLGGGKNLMIGNLIELQFGQGRNWPLGAALAITLMVAVMIALLFYVRNAGGAKGGAHG
ncbi:MAG: ABC transporter permease [Hyphomicrobiaceae bacterium]